MLLVPEETDQVIVAKAYEAEQGHVFRFWQDLSLEQQRALLDQVREIDFHLLASLASGTGPGIATPHPAEHAIAPPDVVSLPEGEGARAERDEARKLGEESLARGEVAVLLAAGGVATRLAWPGPKGTFPIGPVTDRSLYRIFGEQVAAASRRYGRPIPWLILTSSQNHEATFAHLRAASFYGLAEDQVRLFRQRDLPVLSLRGKILLEAPDRIAMSPNGHGGALAALRELGELERLVAAGVRVVSYIQVDNPLVRAVDPVFLGLLLARGSEMGTKVVSKAHPDERVGVLARCDGKHSVIEYSELSDDLRTAREPGGRLAYRAGNTAIHLFAIPFLERLMEPGGVRLPYHRAVKKVAHIGPKGEAIDPAEPNAVKFELFIFDAMSEAKEPLALEIARDEEFAPVKNAIGEDSPDTAREALLARAARWLEATGRRIPRGPDGRRIARVETSPLTAMDEGELLATLGDREIDLSGDVVL